MANLLVASPRPHVRAEVPAVSLSNVSFAYRSGERTVEALSNIGLDIADGRFVAIVGPSGCGKSSLLHLLCGMRQPDVGQISLFGKPSTGLATGIGYVSQSDGLLAWKTVADNIALPLRIQGAPAEQIRLRVEDWLHRTGLTRFARSYPSQLSGGMRKRVAIAQALVQQPRLVLMDEPLSALDVQTRTLIGNDLLALWARCASTVVMVTHDLEEAIGMADEVVVLTARPARIKARYQVGLPRPRDLHDVRLTPDFQALYAAIWRDMREEVLLSHVQEN